MDDEPLSFVNGGDSHQKPFLPGCQECLGTGWQRDQYGFFVEAGNRGVGGFRAVRGRIPCTRCRPTTPPSSSPPKP